MSIFSRFLLILALLAASANLARADGISNSASAAVAGQLPGTATNDNASAGNVGEYVTASLTRTGSALTTATPLTVTSISLTAGDWDVSGQIGIGGTSTAITEFISYIGTITNTFPGVGPAQGAFLQSGAQNVSAIDVTQGTPIVRMSLSATTTVYLIARATFSSGTVSAWGNIRARRVR